MANNTREYFGLTQERMANWLGTSRTALVLAETGHRSLPAGTGTQDARLVLAKLGLALDSTGASSPTTPLLAPSIEPRPFVRRLQYCRHQLTTMRYELEDMRRRASVYEARLVALPALRRWNGPVRNLQLEQSWLALFEDEAVAALRYECGAGPQRLLEARIAGLEREAELLEEMLADPTPAVQEG